MKTISIILLLLISQNSFAQRDSGNGKMPRYSVRLTTMNDNALKGLLLQVKDSLLWVYPGSRKEWKSNVRYKPVAFVYTRIKEVTLKKKTSAFKKILIAGNGSNTYYLNGNRTAFIEFKKLIQ